MNHPMPAVLKPIEDAQLPPATERVAMRLLARVEWTPSGYAFLVIAWEDFCALCNRESRSTARRHLSTLTQAALVHYSTCGDDIHLTWIGVARPPSASTAHTLTDDCAHPFEFDDDAALHPDGCADETASVSPAHRHRRLRTPVSHARANGGGGMIFSHPHEDPTTTNHPPTISDQLRAIGLRPNVTPIHRDLRPDDVRRILDVWQQDAAAREVGTGALLYRLRRGITPVDSAAVERRDRDKYAIPDELRDILIG